MTDAETWAKTYGMDDIPEELHEKFLMHMHLRGYVRAFGKDRFYKGDVREFFAKVGLDCPPPGRNPPSDM